MAGMLYGVGVGPGDPELVTLKAARILAAVPVVAYFAKRGAEGNGRRIATSHMSDTAEELRLEYPFTTEMPMADPRYRPGMADFYDTACARIARHLDADRDVAVVCEGDPFFYGSYMYLHDRLKDRYATHVVPGITGMSGCWTRAGVPMTRTDDMLCVLQGTMNEDTLADRLAGCDAAVVMKVGRNLAKIRAALARAGALDRAIYVERATMHDERVVRLAEKPDDAAPYFSIVLLPTAKGTR